MSAEEAKSPNKQIALKFSGLDFIETRPLSASEKSELRKELLLSLSVSCLLLLFLPASLLASCFIFRFSMGDLILPSVLCLMPEFLIILHALFLPDNPVRLLCKSLDNCRKAEVVCFSGMASGGSVKEAFDTYGSFGSDNLKKFNIPEKVLAIELFPHTCRIWKINGVKCHIYFFEHFIISQDKSKDKSVIGSIWDMINPWKYGDYGCFLILLVILFIILLIDFVK